MEPRIIERRDGRTDFELHEDHPLRLCRAAGSRIEALAGTIWITAYGELTDFELAPGQTFVVPNDRLALVEPIGRGMVRIEAPRPVRRGLARLLALLRPACRAASACEAACLPASSR